MYSDPLITMRDMGTKAMKEFDHVKLTMASAALHIGCFIEMSAFLRVLFNYNP